MLVVMCCMGCVVSCFLFTDSGCLSVFLVDCVLCVVCLLCVVWCVVFVVVFVVCCWLIVVC